jgi:hypothetical protein
MVHTFSVAIPSISLPSCQQYPKHSSCAHNISTQRWCIGSSILQMESTWRKGVMIWRAPYIHQFLSLKMGGILCILFNSERVLTPISRHNFPSHYWGVSIASLPLIHLVKFYINFAFWVDLGCSREIGFWVHFRCSRGICIWVSSQPQHKTTKYNGCTSCVLDCAKWMRAIAQSGCRQGMS